MWMGRVALSSLYRVNDAICENAYCNIGLMGGAGPGDDRKKSHHFRDLQQGKGALRHQESFPILVEATYLAPLAIFFFRDEFAADSPLQRRVRNEPCGAGKAPPASGAGVRVDGVADVVRLNQGRSEASLHAFPLVRTRIKPTGPSSFGPIWRGSYALRGVDPSPALTPAG